MVDRTGEGLVGVKEDDNSRLSELLSSTSTSASPLNVFEFKLHPPGLDPLFLPRHSPHPPLAYAGTGLPLFQFLGTWTQHPILSISYGPSHPAAAAF